MFGNLFTGAESNGMNRFGRWLLTQLRQRSMTHRELAERVGVARPTVTRWVNGWDAPDTENIIRLAEALGVEKEVIIDLLGIQERPASRHAGRPPAEVVWVTVLAPTIGDDFDKWLSESTFEFPWVPHRRLDRGEPIYGFVLTHNHHAPLLLEGDLLVIDPKAPQTDGSFGLIVVGDEPQVRQLRLVENRWVFRGYDDRPDVPADTAIVVGMVVSFQRNVSGAPTLTGAGEEKP